MWLVLVNGKPAGWPSPFSFKTKKEAKVKAQKLAHQIQYAGVEVTVVSETQYEAQTKN